MNGKDIRRRLAENRLKVGDLAKILGVSTPLVSRVIHGQRRTPKVRSAISSVEYPMISRISRIRRATSISCVLTSRSIAIGLAFPLIFAYKKNRPEPCPTVRKMLEENRTEKLAAAIETGVDDGMQTFNQALYDLVKEGKITQKEALAKASAGRAARCPR